MARTTPPRPLDVEALFPEVAAFRKPATRLHPRPGEPGPRESSMGGPVLWPSSEPWPHCADEHPRTAYSPPRTTEGPVPLVPVLQLFAADLPGLELPPGTDLLQLLWCPLEHDPDFVPRPEVFRWDSARTDLAPVAPSRPDGADDDYLPNPCVLHPEVVTDYPNWDLPEEVADALRARFEQVEEETGWSYWYHLSVSGGIKVGGYPTWTQEPDWPDCPSCDRTMRHLLTVNSREFDGEGWRTWLAVEDTPAEGEIWDLPYEERTRIQCPPGLTIGDMGGVYLFECPECPGRPFAYRSDCS
ncbi:DUF1963 domain-containing protein [Kitasatospora sp. NPDC056076]|uniref:DUF1963 domain-containing protein n=1 Tax=Kitasatospora sp. NPDC056076 TaxID=3345703 RepID=UPI0035D669AC